MIAKQVELAALPCVTVALLAGASVAPRAAAQATPPPAGNPVAAADAVKPLFRLDLGDTTLLEVPGWEGARFWIEGRWRSEYWAHFDTPATDGRYDFSHFRFRQGMAQTVGPAEFGFEWQSTNVFGVDPDAPVGPGKAYLDANGSRSPQNLTIRQLYAELDAGGTKLRGGRQLLEDGGAVKYDDGAFQWVRDRGNGRLIGNLEWPGGGRSYDGLSLRREEGGWIARAIAFEVNQGAFEVDDGGDSLENLHVGGIELINRRGGLLADAELRGFAYVFRDDRAVTRTKFGDDLFTTTAGGQFAARRPVGGGVGDLFLWGAVQRGDAGTRAQRAGAWIAETGYRLEDVAWKPWLRLGHTRAQGDSEAADGEVNDFFNGTPTNHPYYGFVDLFALSNLRNTYVDLILDPHPQLRFMASAHLLAGNHDDSRATFGSGAFTEKSFGYGTFATTSRNFGKELDLTLRATTADKRHYLLLGWSWFRGGTAFERLFDDANATFGYLEAGFRF
ncbi:MAG: hypothetical protein FJ293_01180 [Planctomycetes bacterium]|nr:hypothetical protein [Planctomycetota bacterium]